MTHDEFNAHLAELVRENIKTNSKAIEDTMAFGITSDMDPFEIQTRLITRAVNISVEISTKLVFGILDQVKVLPVDELGLEFPKPSLHVVSPDPQK